MSNEIVRIDDMSGAGLALYGSAGAGVGQFTVPMQTFVALDGKTYICDSNNNRIVRIDDMSGANWVSFGTAGSGVGGLYGI